MSFHVPEQYRLTTHPTLNSTPKDGNNGAFFIRDLIDRDIFVIASDGDGWEHVSVHAVYQRKNYTPEWEEMCKVKDIFWDEEDVVIQFHPKKSEYVNIHRQTLHMWRQIGKEVSTPPRYMLGW